MLWSIPLLFISLIFECLPPLASACKSPLGCDHDENPFYIPELDRDTVSQRLDGRPVGVHPSAPLQTSSRQAIPTTQQIQSLPACTISCTGYFSETLQAALQAENHYDRYRQVCEKYNSTADCMSVLPDDQCKNKEMFYITTSGLKYMCVEQRAAFNATIQCIDYHSDTVQNECESDCKLSQKLGNVAVTLFRIKGISSGGGGGGGGGVGGAGLGALLGGLGQGVDGLQFLGAGQEAIDRMLTLQVALKEGCEFSQCCLDCIRKKFNVYCQGAAGALLTEAFVRPLVDAHQNPMVNVMLNVLERLPMPVLPKQCSFIVNSETLRKLRIDPKVEQDVQRMYAEKQPQAPTPQIASQKAKVGNSTKVAADAAVDADMNLIAQMQQQADAEEKARLDNNGRKSPLDAN